MTYWIKPLASTVYAKGTAPAISTQDNIIINGFSLQNSNIITSTVWEDNIVNFESFNAPKSNGRGLLWYYFRWKTINLKTTIKGVDSEDFQQRLDNLRKNVFKSEVNLDIKVNWIIRRIKVSWIKSPKILEHYNINFLQINISLETLEPFFYLLNSQNSSYLLQTSSFQEEITNEGTAEADLITYIIFATVSWANEIIINIWDNTITISETINSNDVVIVNWEDKTVKINDIEVDYLGTFPMIKTDVNPIYFTINWTWTADITVLNKINYV